MTTCSVRNILARSPAVVTDAEADRLGRAMIDYSPPSRDMLHMWQVRARARLLISNDKERHTP